VSEKSIIAEKWTFNSD